MQVSWATMVGVARYELQREGIGLILVILVFCCYCYACVFIFSDLEQDARHVARMARKMLVFTTQHRRTTKHNVYCQSN